MVERGLVPTQITEEPLISKKQQEELYRIARITYLRGHKIPIDSLGILDQAMGVLGDALRRQLGEEGRASIAPNEKLKPLIEKGLLLRDRLCQQAQEVIELSRKNEVTSPELMGPFALSPSLLTLARKEIGGYLLIPQLKHAQQLVDISRQRAGVIDRLMNIGLSNLPEKLRGVTPERFPDLADRAKLVRNMIASFVLRGNFNPLITISDLKDFVRIAGKSQLNFSDEAKEVLTSELNLSLGEERAFIFDLFKQTREAFSVNQSVPAPSDTQGIDKFYRGFSKDLLLLHPALEEEQIITSVKKVTPDSLNLWREAAVIGNSKVPKPEMLAQAIRQARARGDNHAAEQLYQGIIIWKKHDSRVGERAAKIKRLEERLKDRKALLVNLSDSSFPLPNEAYSLRYSSEKKVQDVRMVAAQQAREARRLTEIMENSLREQSEAKEYTDWLRATYGDNLPDSVPMPRGVFLQKLRDETRSLRTALAANNSKCEIIEELLNLDFLFPSTNETAFGYLKKKNGKDWIEQDLTRVHKLNEQIKEKPEDFFHEKQKSFRLLSAQTLEALKKRLAKQNLPSVLRSYWSFWFEAYRNLNKYMRVKPDTRDKYYRGLVQEGMEQRINLLEYARPVLEKSADLTSKLANAQEAYGRLLEKPQEPLPFEATWSKEDAQEYVAEIKASELPDLKGLSLDDLQKTILEMRKFLVLASLSTLPLIIPEKSRLYEWTNQRVTKIRKELEEKTQEALKMRAMVKSRREFMQYATSEERATEAAKNKDHKRQIKKIEKRASILKKQLVFSLQAQEFLDYPLVPSFDEGSMKREKFLRIWRRRVEFVDVLCNSEETRQKSESARGTYLVLLRNSYMKRVGREVELMQDDLKVLETTDINKQFIDNMREIGLVMEEEIV